LNEVSSVTLEQSLRNLDSAFANFFAQRAGYPAFKKRRGPQSARYAVNAFTFKEGALRLAKQSEPLDISWSRPLPQDAELVSLTVSQDTAGRYFVSILVTTEVKQLKRRRKSVGVDLGL
jgi:putative transposase